MRTVCGRPDLADYVPTQDAEAVARLRRSGAIIVGKTNMPTGNADVQASNPVFGRTNNPWDRSRTSGGSAGVALPHRVRRRLRLRLRNRWLNPDSGALLWPLRPQVDVAVGSTGRPHPRRPGRSWTMGRSRYGVCRSAGAWCPRHHPALEATVGPLNPDGGFSYTLAPPRATALKDFRVACGPTMRTALSTKTCAGPSTTLSQRCASVGARVVEHPASIPVDMATSHELFLSLVMAAFSVDRSTISARFGSALALRSLRHPAWRRRRRNAGNDPKSPCVVVPRRGASGDRAALGRILQRVRRAAAAGHTHRCARPPQQGS